jgi:hypothetical protein
MTNEENYTPYVEWRRVPQRVAELIPYALAAKLAHEKAAVAAGIASTTAATWMPELNAVTVYTPAPLSKTALDIYEREMADGDRNLAVVPMMDVAPDWAEEIIIKQGTLIPGLPTVWNTGNKLLGGPTPLSNGIVASVLGAGAGYGAGTLAEHLFPERYLQRGKLRRTLAAMGALGGVGLAGVNAYANARALRTGMLSGLVTHNETPVVSPYEQAKLEKESFDQFGGDFLHSQMNQQLGMNAMQQANQQQFMQQGMFNQQQQSSLPPMYQPTVPVAQFNNAMWNDVRKGMTNGFDTHTPPQYAAATTGLMSGISTNNNSPIIRPIDVVTGIASAGVGLATAHIVGKTLSALAGLTPAGQNKLQDMGLWGGMMHAIVPSMFGR